MLLLVAACRQFCIIWLYDYRKFMVEDDYSIPIKKERKRKQNKWYKKTIMLIQCFFSAETVENGQLGASGWWRAGEHHWESQRDGGALRTLLWYDHHL